MIPFANPWVILGALGSLLVAIVSGFFYGKHVEGLEWKVSLQNQKVMADKILLEAQTRATVAEKQYNALNIQTEKDHAAAESDIQAAHDANLRLVAQLGGVLRDKAGRASRADNVPAAPAPAGSGPSTTTGCDLSIRVTSDLLALARRADEAAAYGQACHAWSLGVKMLP